jgi:hypothetical protein
MRKVKGTKDRLYSEERKSNGNHEKGDRTAEKQGETEKIPKEK